MDKKRKILILFFFLNFFFINNASGNERNYFMTLKYNEVKVRKKKKYKNQIKFIYKKKYLPVKIIDSKDNFKKIIDLKNNDGWIHISQLTKKKSAINIFNLSIVFKKPNIYSQPLAKLEKGKLVTIKKCKKKWCKILAENNQFWIQKKFLWGKF